MIHCFDYIEFFSERDKKLFGEDCETPWKQVYNIAVPSAALSFLDGGALWQEGRGNFPRAKSWLTKKDRPGALGTKTCKQNRQKCLIIKKKNIERKKMPINVSHYLKFGCCYYLLTPVIFSCSRIS